MRKNIVAGNWKMNKTLKEGIELTKGIVNLTNGQNLNADVIIAPPFIHLSEVSKIISNSVVQLSAQNCSSEPSGAYTGEISPAMLKSVGCEYAIIGHSERRAYYHEDDTILKKKAELALSSNLNVIFCIGEQLEDREADNHFNIIKSQLENTILQFNKIDFNKIIVAYEPVWAIGTGRTASPEQAQEMHAFIRNLISNTFNSEVAEDTTILYGGSCKPSNAKELFANKDVDGGLIGGAALKADDFVAIIKAFE